MRNEIRESCSHIPNTVNYHHNHGQRKKIHQQRRELYITTLGLAGLRGMILTIEY